MSMQDDVVATRQAVAALEAVTGRLLGHFGDTVDTRRLAHDVARLRADLDLLGGCAPSGPVPQRERIPDIAYPHDFWAGSDDEGLGAADRRARR